MSEKDARLSEEEARQLIKTIEQVEIEEADAIEAAKEKPASDKAA